MRDPFAVEFSDGTAFDYKAYLASVALGMVAFAAGSGAVVAWSLRSDIKDSVKNRFKKNPES